MDQQALEKKITETLERNRFGSFATVENGQPKVRYMTVFNEGMTIYLVTSSETHKVEELEKNPKVALLLGFEQGGTQDEVQIQGTAEITRDEELRKRLWKDAFEQWLEGPDDPNYVVLKITPSRAEYAKNKHEVEVWEG
ncbi:general stress protein [Saccharibacillus sp. O16]|nr:general stress protein [Saccharibacillus sp. O16]